MHADEPVLRNDAASLARSTADRPAPRTARRSGTRAGAPVGDTWVAKSTLPTVDGKFLRVDGQRFWVKGVTYGTFSPNDAGEPYPRSTS